MLGIRSSSTIRLFYCSLERKKKHYFFFLQENDSPKIPPHHICCVKCQGRLVRNLFLKIRTSRQCLPLSTHCLGPFTLSLLAVSSPSLCSPALFHSDLHLHLRLRLQLPRSTMAMYTIPRRVQSGSATVVVSRFATSLNLRFYSTSFREERDTFGPILVPSDKFRSSLYSSFFQLNWISDFSLILKQRNDLYVFVSGCGVLKRRDRCRISKSVESVSVCPSPSFGPSESSKNAPPRFSFFLSFF